MSVTGFSLESFSNIVFASYRSPATALDLEAFKSSPGTLHIIQIDVMDEIRVIELLSGTGLINNARVDFNIDFAFSFDLAELAETIKCDFTGPALAMRFLLPVIEKSSRKVIVHTSSPTTASARLPSICLTYKRMRERPDITPVLVTPGWVKTETGGEGTLIEPHVSDGHLEHHHEADVG